MQRRPIEGAWWRSDWAKRIWFAVFLVYLIYPTIGFLEEGRDSRHTVVTLLTLIAFAACYLRVMWAAVGHFGQNRSPYALGALVGVSVLLVFELHREWLIAHPYYLLTCLAVSLNARGYIVGSAVVLGTLPPLAWAVGFSPAETVATVGQSLITAVAIRIFVVLAETVAELQQARAEIARLAVESERLRFARDLHDTLGHALSAIAVKSELARKLVRRDNDRAEAELVDIEQVARSALQDVRETVAGYRSLSLHEQLDGARQVLRAAGISCSVEGADEPLPAETGSLLAWVLREAATNVVRHSRASVCNVRLRRDGRTAELRVADDGVGPGVATDGHGLAGLAERVTGVGGTLDTGPRHGGGFELLARVPLDGRS
jgi:two-component system, NarL family, sensor histidine kinase DesK